MNAKVGVAGALAIVMGVSIGCNIATVRRLDDEDARTEETAGAAQPFDAAALVTAAWDADVLPALTRARALDALAADDAISGPVVVQGRGRVVEANVRSRAGTAIVDPGNGTRVAVQIGPVLTGTAIRDALPAFGFDRFVNQIQHADVGNELNARVEQQVLERLDRTKLPGSFLSFAGMARRDEHGLLTVTPVRLDRQDRP